MYCAYQNREELEDDLYQEDDRDSEGSETDSELEFRLYSQLHYSSNAGEKKEQGGRGEGAEGEDSQQPEVTNRTADAGGDGELGHIRESRPPSPNAGELLQQLKKKKKKEKGEKRDKQKKRESDPKGQRSSSSLFEEVIVIESSPDVISISEDDTADDDGVCASKSQGLNRLRTSTPAQVEDTGIYSICSISHTISFSHSLR